jgi:hypothetical protein
MFFQLLLVSALFPTELRISPKFKILISFGFAGTNRRLWCLDANEEDVQMQHDTINDPSITAQQLRPVVISVVAAKLAVFALLMTTINFQAPLPVPVEIAEMR